MKTEETPPLPTREQELEYLKTLEASVLSDPWLTMHPKKYMAGPHRLFHKQKTTLKNEYYKTLVRNTILSAFFAWPLIV